MTLWIHDGSPREEYAIDHNNISGSKDILKQEVCTHG